MPAPAAIRRSRGFWKTPVHTDRVGLPAPPRGARSFCLRNVLAPFDPSHQPLELVRRLGAKIGVVHSTKLFGNGEQGLGPQADNVFLCVLLGHGHVGSTSLGTHRQTVCRKPLTRRGTEGSPLRACSGARIDLTSLDAELALASMPQRS